MIITFPKQVKYSLFIYSIEKYFLFLSRDKTIKLWKNEINFKTLEEHAHSVRTFCQINKKYFASGSFDYTIKIWEINSWKGIQTLYGHEFNIICLIALL